MPELPEVETVTRGLKRLEGQEIKQFDIYDDRVWFESEFDAREISGARLNEISRVGKYIVYSCTRPSGEPRFLVQHLRMTGKMLQDTSPALPPALRKPWGRNKQIRFAMELEKECVCFWDTRRFGTITAVKNLEVFFARKHHAPDPVHNPKQAWPIFNQGLAKANRPVKSALLDQSIVAGVGNIYADEAIHLVGLHPEAKAKNLSELKKQELFKAILKLFTAAIAAGGTTANNYLNAAGIPGNYAEKLRVYDRKDEPCLTCKKGKIRRIVLAGRSTHFCSHCQRTKRA